MVVDPGYIAQARDDEKRSVHKSMRGRLYLQGGENVIGKGSSKEVEHTELNCNALVQEYLLGFIKKKGEIGGYEENGFEEMTK